MSKKSPSNFFRIASYFFVFVCVILLTVGTALAEDFNFVSMADARGESTAINKPILDKLVALAAATAPDFVLFEGDTVLGSKKDLSRFKAQLAEFKQAMKPLSDICNIYYAVGNHGRPSRKIAWRRLLARLYVKAARRRGSGDILRISMRKA